MDNASVKALDVYKRQLVDGILQHLCLLGGHVAGADAARGNGKQQGDACSEPVSYTHLTQVAEEDGLLNR